MFTVIETPLFQRQWPLYWTEDERGAFATYLAKHPDAGGVRVIYFTRLAKGELVLLTLYAKAKTDNLTGSKLREIRRALEED